MHEYSRAAWSVFCTYTTPGHLSTPYDRSTSSTRTPGVVDDVFVCRLRFELSRVFAHNEAPLDFSRHLADQLFATTVPIVSLTVRSRQRR